MRIALCSDTYHPIADGVANHLVDYKVELEKRGHSVRVYTVFSTNDGVFGLPSYRFPLYKEYRVGIPVYEMYRDLERFDPQVIHIHTPFTLGTMGYRYARKRNIPTIGTYHTDFVNMDNTVRFPFIKSILNIGFQYNMHLYAKLDMVISPSKLVADHLSDFGNKSKIVPVGIDLSKFVYNENKEDYYLFIGRLTQDKGVLELLEAAARLPNKEFKIAGTGPLRDSVKDYANRYRNIEYLGYVSEQDKIDLLKNAKLLVAPSRAETFGVVFIEAMASGTPVVGSSETREIGILRDDYNGWFVKYGDPESLVSKIRELDGLDMRSYSENARRSSMNYSIQTTADLLEAIYGELIELKIRQ
ncbi:MAG: glycosyltransferase [Thermoplasmatales archaeon]|nr:glycosyltransferase [Candidatus Thermoplasmatota archaeon]MCL6003394.1 glycosyltransferase [Candidatus Thermoplasmatota archaeon]MDA8056092.1 glycosyltransferase [Thermoplasmatales archaeon]